MKRAVTYFQVNAEITSLKGMLRSLKQQEVERSYELCELQVGTLLQ